MKRRFVLAMALLMLGIVGMACGSSASPTAGPSSKPMGDATKGKEKYTAVCAACHGSDAKGLPALGKDLTTSAFVKSQSDEQLRAFIIKGRPASDPDNTTKVDMPPRGGNSTLTDSDIDDIIAYIRTLQQ